MDYDTLQPGDIPDEDFKPDSEGVPPQAAGASSISRKENGDEQSAVVQQPLAQAASQRNDEFPDASDMEPQSAMAGRGFTTMGTHYVNNLKRQFAEGQERLKLSQGPMTDPRTWQAINELATQAAISTVGSVSAPKVAGSVAEDVAQATPAAASPFYSKLVEALKSKMGPTATRQQVEGVLKDVKGEERKWSGIDEFLGNKAPSEPVSKSDVIAHVQQNLPQIKDVVKGGKEAPQTSVEYNGSGYDVVDQHGNTLETYDERRDAEDAAVNNYLGQPGTKFSQYTLPGGENYRENLYTLPEKATKQDFEKDFVNWASQKYGDKFLDMSDAQVQKLSEQYKSQVVSKQRNIFPENTYKSPHWDEPNVLAHTRVNDRIDSEGKKLLHMEEAQSDWHQSGRKIGYQGDTNPAARNAQIDQAMGVLDPNREILGGVEAQQRKNALGVPDAPFRSTWHEYALKKLLHEAAEKGYDKLSWTPGEAQAARYDLSKQVDHIGAFKNKDGTFHIEATKNGVPAVEFEYVHPNDLENKVGKDLAQKIIAEKGDQESSGYRQYSGNDLKVGGEGMKGFYDKIIPDYLNKYAKKYGVKVGESELPGLTWDQIRQNGGKQPGATKVHSLEITPEMRRDILKNGHPLFYHGGQVAHFDEGGAAGASAYPSPQANGLQPGDIPDDQFKPDAQQPGSSSMMQPTADELPQAGDIPDDQFVPDSEKYSTLPQQALAAVEGFGQGFAGPVMPGLEVASGLTTGADILARQHENDALHAVTKVGGFVGSMMTGVGEARVLGAAGEKVVGKLAAKGLVNRYGQAALQGATEMGLMSAGDEVTRAIVQDPTQSVGTALTDITLNGALGLIGAPVLLGAGELLSRANAGHLVQAAEDFKGQMARRMENPNPVEAMHDELHARYDDVTQVYDNVHGLNGIKDQAIEATVPPVVNDSILGQAGDIRDQTEKIIKNMRAKPYHFPERLVNKFEADANEFAAQAFPTDGTVTPRTADIFRATQSLKQMAQSYAKIGDFIKPTAEEYDFVNAMRPLAKDLRASLEDTNVWGKAASLQKNINSAWSNFKPYYDSFEKNFTETVPLADPVTGRVTMEKRVSLPKIQTYTNAAGTFRDEAKKTILKGFLDGSEKLHASTLPAYDEIGQESPFTPHATPVARESLKDLTPGMKLANATVDQGLGKGAAHALAGAAGTTVGGLLAGPYGAGVGAIVGERALGPYFEKVLPILGKSFFEKVADFRGIRAVGKFVENYAAGKKLMSQGARNVFRASAEVLPVSAIPSVTAIHQLNRRLIAAQDNPDQFTQDQMKHNALGTYMPAHQEALAQTITNAVGYINSQRPQTAPQSPLDSKRVPSSVQQGAFNNLLQVAQQPMSVMAKVKAGTVTPDDVKHLTALYPAAYQQMQTELSNAMVGHISKGGSVPYTTRIGMSLFTGQPMDSTMTPQSIQSAQPSPTPAAGQNPSGGQGKKGSTKDLHKISEQAATPEQARQQRETK